jgi:hypothetical protein
VELRRVEAIRQQTLEQAKLAAAQERQERTARSGVPPDENQGKAVYRPAVLGEGKETAAATRGAAISAERREGVTDKLEVTLNFQGDTSGAQHLTPEQITQMIVRKLTSEQRRYKG